MRIAAKDPELQRVYAFFRSHWPGPDLAEEEEEADEGDEAVVEHDGDNLEDDGYDCEEEPGDDVGDDELRQSFGIVVASPKHPAGPSDSTDDPTPEHKILPAPSQTPTDPSPPSAPALKRKAPFEEASIDRHDVRKQRIEQLKLLDLD